MAKRKRSRGAEKPLYLDPSRSADERAADLLARMTLEEKIYQLGAYAPWASQKKTSEAIFLDARGRFSEQQAKRYLGKCGIGGLTCTLHNMKPRQAARVARGIQKVACEHTRLGIPILIHDEALHGLTAIGSTAFPQSIGLAATWDTALVRKVGGVIGLESRTRGIRQVLSPTVNIALDGRAGRFQESYGEDPFLASRMAVAYVKGVQGQGVACTLKHFVANFVADGGRDSGEVHLSERMLREVCFPAFEAAVREAGALGVMAAYNSLDGSPCSSHRWLLTDILRGEWGFRGIVVADYLSVDQVHNCHAVAASPAEGAKQCVEAGLDLELPHFVCYREMIALARQGGVSTAAIDEAVSRMLRVKFMLGLFDEPIADPDRAAATAACAAHLRLALVAARKSIVLLKNRRGVLPFGKNARSIAVIGPNADESRLGIYSTTDAKGVTTLQGLRRRLGKRVTVRHAAGCKVDDPDRSGFARAVKLARESDMAVLVMGNSTETESEGADRCDLDLPGVQEELIEAVAATGTPAVVVLVSGGAVTMGNWIDKVSAVLHAWYPGIEGGLAVADVLLGRVNPAGRLPFTMPRRASQLPLYYNPKPPARSGDYIDLRGDQAQFPFGFGLSYTTFRYSNLRVSPRRIAPGGKVRVQVDVHNTGKRSGDEVVQLYLHDCEASVTRPIKELKAFRRVALPAGKKKTVSFDLGQKDYRFLDRELEYVVEPGRFEVMVGGDSRKGLRKHFEIVAPGGKRTRRASRAEASDIDALVFDRRD